MHCKTRIAQVYELQRIALINANYYGARITKVVRLNRVLQIVASIASSGTIVAVLRDNVPNSYRVFAIAGSVTAALASIVIAVFGITDSLARLERLHSAYKMLYHSAEYLARQTIGSDSLSVEQEAVACMLEMQLAALGPQDEIAPDVKIMRAAQEDAERQLPASYYYPHNVEQTTPSTATQA